MAFYSEVCIRKCGNKKKKIATIIWGLRTPFFIWETERNRGKVILSEPQRKNLGRMGVFSCKYKISKKKKKKKPSVGYQFLHRLCLIRQDPLLISSKYRGHKVGLIAFDIEVYLKSRCNILYCYGHLFYTTCIGGTGICRLFGSLNFKTFQTRPWQKAEQDICNFFFR